MIPSRKQLQNSTDTTIAYISINSDGQNALAREFKKYPIKTISIVAADSLKSLDTLIFKKYKKIIIGLHGINRNPSSNFGITPYYVNAIRLIEAQCPHSVLMVVSPMFMHLVNKAKHMPGSHFFGFLGFVL